MKVSLSDDEKVQNWFDWMFINLFFLSPLSHNTSSNISPTSSLSLVTIFPRLAALTLTAALLDSPSQDPGSPCSSVTFHQAYKNVSLCPWTRTSSLRWKTLTSLAQLWPWIRYQGNTEGSGEIEGDLGVVGELKKELFLICNDNWKPEIDCIPLMSPTALPRKLFLL